MGQDEIGWIDAVSWHSMQLSCCKRESIAVCAREKGKDKSHRTREDYVEDICACTHVVVVVLVVPYQGQESGYLPVQSDESTG